MDTLTFPLSREAVVLVAPQAAREEMLDMAAQLAVAGPLRVLDGGNHFNVYTVARAIGRRTVQVEETLEQIQVARAFTCYQMLALLAESAAGPVPTLVLDLLCTFYDESVPLFERRRLLEAALEHVRRLSQGGPVVVSTRMPSRSYPERVDLVEMVQAVFPVLFPAPETLPEPEQQLALFAF